MAELYSACPKCSSDKLLVAYHKVSSWLHEEQYAEHLHYTCRRCSYDWCGPVVKPKRKPRKVKADG